jgi:hypothetical protein
MGKSDRALFAGLVVLAACVWPQSVVHWPELFAVAAAGAVLTCARRIQAALR